MLFISVPSILGGVLSILTIKFLVEIFPALSYAFTIYSVSPSILTVYFKELIPADNFLFLLSYNSINLIPLPLTSVAF